MKIIFLRIFLFVGFDAVGDDEGDGECTVQYRITYSVSQLKQYENSNPLKYNNSAETYMYSSLTTLITINLT